ncbi:MAG TPA: nicotinate-nucleotide adenylyltransferase [Porticoccaceae bacterium]|nr:nicotinate-nucleotide adenylyltransferase [Porticoccaceae bacterium]
MDAIGLFGGTFDPVHIGHLRTAVELREALGLRRVLLVPSARPPHRAPPRASAVQRLAMLAAAIGDEPGLVADARERRRAGLSYTIDTLAELRAELGPGVALCLCLGMDALVGLASWHRWREFTDLAHLVVAARPGWQAPESGPVAEWLAERWVQDPAALHATAHGRALIRALTLLPVSSSGLREDLAAARSVRYLVPDAALAYLRDHRLYAAGGGSQLHAATGGDSRELP